MTTEIITDKFDVLRGRLLGNHNDFHWIRIAYGCPYCKGSAIFSLVFLSTTSEKSFIPYKASAAAQARKVCPVRPRVLSEGVSGRPRVLSSWGIPLLRAAVDAWKSVCSSHYYSRYHPTNSTHFQKSTKKRRFVQFGQESCPAGEYLHSERLWMPLPSHKLHTFPKIHKKKSWGITLLEKLRAADES